MRMVVSIGFGTTSACAENTIGADDISPAAWNYLRVRGEYTKAIERPLR